MFKSDAFLVAVAIALALLVAGTISYGLYEFGDWLRAFADFLTTVSRVIERTLK